MRIEIITQSVIGNMHWRCIGDALNAILVRIDCKRFRFAVAYMRVSGLRLLYGTLQALYARSGHISGAVGIDQRVTTIEALELLRQLSSDSTIVCTVSNYIYHPKLYLVEGDTWACVFIGSANLTRDGLYRNVELATLIHLDLAYSSDVEIYQYYDAFLSELLNPTNPNIQPLSEATLKWLAETGMIEDEAHVLEPQPVIRSRKATAKMKDLFPALPVPSVPVTGETATVLNIGKETSAISFEKLPSGSHTIRSLLLADKITSIASVYLFDTDDGAFMVWMEQNPKGFVINTGRTAMSSYVMYHKANCIHIASYSSWQEQRCFTQGQYIKVCSTNLQELLTWRAQHRSRAHDTYCQKCAPSPIDVAVSYPDQVDDIVMDHKGTTTTSSVWSLPEEKPVESSSGETTSSSLLAQEVVHNGDILDLLNQGAEVWNQWRKEHRQFFPDLSSIDLHGKDLRGFNFSGVNFQGADFHGANLFSVNFFGANFQLANLKKAILYSANLTKADLRGANLTGADLTRAYLKDAVITGAHLGQTRHYNWFIEGIICTMAYWGSKPKFYKAGEFARLYSANDINNRSGQNQPVRGARNRAPGR